MMMSLGLGTGTYGAALAEKVNDPYVNLSASEALEMIEADKDAVVLDVRTPMEFDGELGHIDGAILIPIQELQTRIGELEPYKDKKILVVCRVGNRSRAASEFLSQNGFSSIYNMATGMVGIRELGVGAR